MRLRAAPGWRWRCSLWNGCGHTHTHSRTTVVSTTSQPRRSCAVTVPAVLAAPRCSLAALSLRLPRTRHFPSRHRHRPEMSVPLTSLLRKKRKGLFVFSLVRCVRPAHSATPPLSHCATPPLRPLSLPHTTATRMSVTLSDAERCVCISREVLLRHLDGAPPQRSFDLLSDDDGLLRSFPSTPESRAAQQFLLALRQHADLLNAAAVAASIPPAVAPPPPAVACASSASASAPIDDAGDVSDASTVIAERVAPPPAASSADADEFPLEWCSDSDSGDYPDGDEQPVDSSIVNSSAAENSDYSGDDGDRQDPCASIVNGSDSGSDDGNHSSTSDEDAERKKRYFDKLGRKLHRAVAIEDQRLSNKARKHAHHWFRRKMRKTNAPSRSVEINLNRARRAATEKRNRLFPDRRN